MLNTDPLIKRRLSHVYMVYHPSVQAVSSRTTQFVDNILYGLYNKIYLNSRKVILLRINYNCICQSTSAEKKRGKRDDFYAVVEVKTGQSAPRFRA